MHIFLDFTQTVMTHGIRIPLKKQKPVVPTFRIVVVSFVTISEVAVRDRNIEYENDDNGTIGRKQQNYV